MVLSQADSRDAESLFDRLQVALQERPLPEIGVVSFSAGVAELLPKDDATALIVRADAALGLAKSSGRDMVVTAAKRPRSPRGLGPDHLRKRRRPAAILPGEPARRLGLVEREESARTRRCRRRRARGTGPARIRACSLPSAAFGCDQAAYALGAPLGSKLAHDRGTMRIAGGAAQRSCRRRPRP